MEENFEISKAEESIISDEVLRYRIRKIIDQPPRESIWVRVSKHPLLALLIGFVLTWGVGTQLTEKWKRNQISLERDAQAQKDRQEKRISALGEYFGIFYEHSAQTQLFERALRRDASAEELKKIMDSRDKMYIEANAKMGLIYFQLRNLLDPKIYLEIVDSLDDGIYIPMQLADELHAEAHQNLLSGKDGMAKVKIEEASEITGRISGCLIPFSNAIWFNSIAEPKSNDPQEVKSMQRQKERSLHEMKKACSRGE